MTNSSKQQRSTVGRSQWLPAAGLGFLVVAAVVLFLQLSQPGPKTDPQLSEIIEPSAPLIDPNLFPQVVFREVSAELGIDFVHHNGADSRFMMPVPFGSGGGFFDCDNDGDQDMLLLSCCQIDDYRNPPRQGRSIVLYENDGKGNFKDITAGSGLEISCYAMGLAMADYDNDGWRDIFVTAVGANRLFRCSGRGTYEDVTEQAGVAGASEDWSSSAGFFDCDNDGDLDLFVCNYAQWTPEQDLAVQERIGQTDSYMPPRFFAGSSCLLYENDGGVVFRDISESSGVTIRDGSPAEMVAKALGVIFVDLDRDGWLDIVVANDQTRSFLLRNRGDRTFEDMGLKSGFGHDSNGRLIAGMGLDFCQIEGETSVLIALTNDAKYHTAVYISQQDGFSFADHASVCGMMAASKRVTTFGLIFLDYDLDGHLDLLQANGHINSPEGSRLEGVDYFEPTQLFWYHNARDTMYEPVPTRKCGRDLYEPILGRAAAFADIDADGDLDVLVTANDDRIRLFRNENQLGHNWLRVELRARGSNRDAIGAALVLEMDQGSQNRWVMPTRSYLSQVELPVTFGLGKDRQPRKLTIRWPDGSQQEVTDLPMNKHLLIEQPAIGPGDDVK